MLCYCLLWIGAGWPLHVVLIFLSFFGSYNALSSFLISIPRTGPNFSLLRVGRVESLSPPHLGVYVYVHCCHLDCSSRYYNTMAQQRYVCFFEKRRTLVFLPPSFSLSIVLLSARLVGPIQNSSKTQQLKFSQPLPCTLIDITGRMHVVYSVYTYFWLLVKCQWDVASGLWVRSSCAILTLSPPTHW